MVSVPASQAGYEGSIPFTRSILLRHSIVQLRSGFAGIALLTLCLALAVALSGCKTTTSHRVATATTAAIPALITAVPEISDIRAPGAVYHTVKKGETLWRISKQYNIDIETLLDVNSIQDKTAIEVGQVLIIPSFSKKKEPVKSYIPRDSFIWPVTGTVISTFGSSMDKTKNKGVDIRAGEGTEVKASRGGNVVFCDDKLKGYGMTVIVDHGDNYQTVYAYNSEILVKVGDTIKQSDVVAKVGRTGRAREACLHFEIRKNGEPRDPYYFLKR